MARLFPFPVFIRLQPPAPPRPVISCPSPAAATTSEIRQFLSVIRHGKPQTESGKPSVKPHPVLPQRPVFLVPAQPFSQPKNTESIPGFLPGREERPQTHNQLFIRNDIPKKNNDSKSTTTDVPAEIPAENVPRTGTEKMTAHLEIRQADIITRITDTLVTRITHISRQTETLTTCRAAFPALGEIRFTVHHRAEGIHIQICCPPGGVAFLQSCLPQLQERLTQKIPQAVTLSLAGANSAVRRK